MTTAVESRKRWKVPTEFLAISLDAVVFPTKLASCFDKLTITLGPVNFLRADIATDFVLTPLSFGCFGCFVRVLHSVRKSKVIRKHFLQNSVLRTTFDFSDSMRP